MINVAQVSRSLSTLNFADNAFATIVMEYQPLDANIREIRTLVMALVLILFIDKLKTLVLMG